MTKALSGRPSISVIIPCYNQGQYLQEALDSIYSQGYPDIEVIVVDDGSTDNTKDVVAGNPVVKYFHQSNEGPSSARNNGMRNSRGELLVFLDADDWLLPGAIKTNLSYLKKHPECAFVSGGYRLYFADCGTTEDTAHKVTKNHYLHFLKMNFIGMHATVMYQRWVFREFEFSTTMRASEDYDLYLRVTRKYPIHHHGNIVAVYRIHPRNTSAAFPMMLWGVLRAHGNQKKMLTTDLEKEAYAVGRRDWIKYYCKEIIKKKNEGKRLTPYEWLTLAKYLPFLLISRALG